MTIHRRMLIDVHVCAYTVTYTFPWEWLNSGNQTRRRKVTGFLWQQAPRRNVLYKFNADVPEHGITAIHPPYVDIEGSFTLPTPAPPEVCNTLIQVSGHTILVSGYLDNRLERNPNLRRDFPLIPWPGEIAVLFVGKRKPFLTRGPPESDIHFAIAQ
jgi:hypothetical protein